MSEDPVKASPPKKRPMSTIASKKIGSILLDAGLITAEQMKTALQKQAVSGKRLGALLVEMDYLSEENLVTALSQQLGVPSVDLGRITIHPDVLKILPGPYMLKHEVLPLRLEDAQLLVTMVNPLDRSTVEEIAFMTGYEVIPMVTSSSAMSRYLEQHVGKLKNMTTEAEEALVEKIESDRDKQKTESARSTDVKGASEDRDVARTLNRILTNALRFSVQYIHIKPRQKDILVRFRSEGFLKNMMSFPPAIYPALVYRLKSLARMNPSVSRLPQEGSAQFRAEGRTVDFQVSVLPTLHGEKVVIRILDMHQQIKNPENLGMHPKDLSAFYTLLAGPPGILLMAGPVDSGITTTLYTALRYMRTEENNIVTIEDPIEYELPGINQVQVGGGGPVSLSQALRIALQQDPDIIMTSGIREPETARLVYEAACRGYRVLSSLHVNHSVAAITHLAHLNFAPHMIAATLSGTIAQRLVRRNCQHCLERYVPEPRVFSGLNINMREISKTHFYRGKGCRHCNGAGYTGRIGIFEILSIDHVIREMIANRAPVRDIFHTARKNGMTTMQENGLYMVLNKITTLEEILRVVPREETGIRREGAWEEHILSAYDDAIYVL